jgi:hypothetical protein
MWSAPGESRELVFTIMAHFAGGANEQIGVGHVGGVEA